MFNAVFFSGLEDVYHKPHSYYISRYPAGREATVYEGQIDLQWKNDSDTGVYIDTAWTPGTITVTFYGTKRYEIESISGNRSTSASRRCRRCRRRHVQAAGRAPRASTSPSPGCSRTCLGRGDQAGELQDPLRGRADHPLHARPARPDGRPGRRPAADAARRPPPPGGAAPRPAGGRVGRWSGPACTLGG
jgi:hypothetical protein